MDAQKYHRLTASPLFVGRLVIEETASILSERCDSAKVALIRLLETPLLTKPDRHLGDFSTDFFDTTGLSTEVLENICNHLFEAEADAVPPSGETTQKASRIALLADLWHERNEIDVTALTTSCDQVGDGHSG